MTAPRVVHTEPPTFRPNPWCLADAELVLDGLLSHTQPLGGAVPPPAAGRDNQVVTLTVPPGTAETSGRAGGLFLVDAESTPVALLEDIETDRTHPGRVSGRLRRVRDGEHGVGRDLRISQPAVASVLAAARITTVFVLGRPLLEADVAAVSRSPEQTVVVVPVAGATPDGIPATSLLRMTRADLTPLGVPLVAAPIAWRDRVSDEALAHHVRVGLGGAHLVHLRTSARSEEPGSSTDADWARLLADLRSGVPDLSGAVSDETLRELRRWRPPKQQRGLVVLFTGLSGSGKSTLARGLVTYLEETGERTVSLLDGDVVRSLLSQGLGYSREDRDLNVRRIGFVAAEVARHGGVAVCAPIAPYESSRAAVRSMAEEVGDFVLVHVSTPLEECERRDLKGLYSRARAGEITSFTGISDPYEEPADADLTLDTSVRPIQEGVDEVVALLRAGGWLRKRPVEG